MREHKYKFNWKAIGRIRSRANALGYEAEDYPWLIKILQEQVNQRLEAAPGSSMHLEFPILPGAVQNIDERTVPLSQDCFEDDQEN